MFLKKIILISVLLPSIHVNMSDDRVFEGLNVAMSIPLPGNELEEPMPLLKVNTCFYVFVMLTFLSLNKGS